MEFSDYLSRTLRPTESETAKVLDLFTGAGGLSLGFEAAGFRTTAYEMDKAACETYNLKSKRKYTYTGFLVEKA
jgi:DNA (cytosine-5)-methyltransferase 1